MRGARRAAADDRPYNVSMRRRRTRMRTAWRIIAAMSRRRVRVRGLYLPDAS